MNYGCFFKGWAQTWGLAILLMIAMGIGIASGACPPCYIPNPDYDPNNPYESDPECIPIDKGDPPSLCHTWNDETCRWDQRDPGPKPNGCYRLDDTCKWVPYTPDCTAQEEEVGSIELSLYWLAQKIAWAKLEKAKMEKYCACERNPLMCVFLPPDARVPPEDPCGQIKDIEEKIKALEKEEEELLKALEAARKALEDCRNCW